MEWLRFFDQSLKSYLLTDKSMLQKSSRAGREGMLAPGCSHDHCPDQTGNRICKTAGTTGFHCAAAIAPFLAESTDLKTKRL